MPRIQPERRDRFPHFLEITTRWMDNDIYQHVNNVTYYSYFDTVVNQFLVAEGELDFVASPFINLVVETGCQYFSPVAFPDRIHAGLRVAHLGTSSVRYEVGIFRNDEPLASAQGHFVHVHCERATSKPMPLPESMRRKLARIAAPGTMP